MVKRLANDFPGVAGDVLEVGARTFLHAHGVESLEANEVAVAVGAITKDALATIQHERPKAHPYVLRISNTPDPAVTPCSFIYALPVHRLRVQDRVAQVVPDLWLSSQAAWIYADYIAHEDLGVGRLPLLVSADQPLVEAHADQLTQSAWDRWCRVRQDQRTRHAPVPFGAYVVGELPGAGYIVWRSMLHTRGVTAGVLQDDSNCSIKGAPHVFRTVASARKEITRRGFPDPVSVLYLPLSLKAELAVDDSGQVTRRTAAPTVWPSDPVTVAPRKRPDVGTEPAFLRPDWYVSRDPRGGAWAWRRVAENQVSFARVRGLDGHWKTAKWPSVEQCLKDLGALGQFGQEHPTLVVAPSLAVRNLTPSAHGPHLR